MSNVQTAQHTPGPTACPICREQIGAEGHHNDLSYDGFGINGCDMYRTQLAKFSKDSPRDRLGPLFAAAPDLLAACQAANAWLIAAGYGSSGCPAMEQLWAAIAKATGE